MVSFFLPAFGSLELVNPSLAVRHGSWISRIKTFWPSDLPDLLVFLGLVDQSTGDVLDCWSTWLLFGAFIRDKLLEALVRALGRLVK